MMKLIIAAVVFIFLLPGCEKQSNLKPALADHIIIISTRSLTEKDIEWNNTRTLKQTILGCDFDRDEVYIAAEPGTRDSHIIRIIDLFSFQVKKELTLPRGSFESPSDFYNPTYMQFLDGRYYIIDQFEKYVVFDERFNRLYHSIFAFQQYYKIRRFIDFYGTGGRVFFVFGHIIYLKTSQKNIITLNEAIDNRRPKTIEQIFSVSLQAISWELKIKNRHTFYYGLLWPSVNGFEKDGKIYYSVMTENRYYTYDLKSKQTSAIDLDFLKPRRFTDEQAEQFYQSVSPGSNDNQISRRKRVRVAYPGEIFHLGMYDVGKNKIGFIGDIDLQSLKFRLDVIDTRKYTYLESLWMPYHYGLMSQLSENVGVTNYINLDKGIYTWHFLDEDGEFAVHLSRFKTRDKQKP